MKKQTIKFKRSKNSIKGLAFLKIIVISIMLVTSCSKDNYDNNYNTNVVNNGIEKIPITELQNDEVFKAIFSKKFNNKSFDSYLSSKNAITHKEKDEFYFPEKNAVIMKSDSLISYTMLIKRNDKKVNYFENLVIQINSKNQYSVNIVKYYPKKFQEQKEHNSFSLESDKELVMISRGNKQTNKSNLINNETCITITYSLCNHSYIHIAGPNCGSIFKTVSETVCFDTPSSGDSSNNGSSDNGSGTWGWNYSDSITFPGSGGSYEDGDGGFTINTTPIDPRLDMGIDGSVTYTESYHAFFSQIFYNNLTDLKPWADENPNLYNLILSNVINNNWSVQSLNFANFGMRFLKENPDVTSDQFENWFMGIDSFEVNPKFQDSNFKIFSNSNDLQVFIEQLRTINSDASESNVVTTIQNQQWATKTIKLTPIIDLTIEIVSNTGSPFTFDKGESKTFISNPVVGNSWVQNSIILVNDSYSSTEAKLAISGYINVGIKMGELEFGIKQRKLIELLVNKSTGKICCVSVSNVKNK